MSSSARRASMVAPPRPRRLPQLLLSVCLVVSSALRGAAVAKTFSAPPATAPAGAARGGRTGVLVHGCHLGAKGWRNIMWGDEQQQRLGRYCRRKGLITLHCSSFKSATPYSLRCHVLVYSSIYISELQIGRRPCVRHPPPEAKCFSG